jgi:hypothetical protein
MGYACRHKNEIKPSKYVTRRGQKGIKSKEAIARRSRPAVQEQ